MVTGTLYDAVGTAATQSYDNKNVGTTHVLSASGLPTNGFLYAGFLPPKSAARTAFFERHRDFPYTIVLFESCHRIDKAAPHHAMRFAPAKPQ